MEHVLDRESPGPLSSFRVERTQQGDVPDYLCAANSHDVFMAEAKGRYTPISFKNKEFNSWRCQFCRVAVKDSRKQLMRVKGYIVATRFATDLKQNIRSEIFAEDPETPGELTLQAGNHDFGNRIIRMHYSAIATKLNQPVLAAALLSGFTIPEEIRVAVVPWEFQDFSLKGTRFIGGYFPSQEGSPVISEQNGRILFATSNPLRLDVGRGTFFGVEESIFRQVVQMARSDEAASIAIRQFENVQPFYSAVSALRDGTILSPIEFLQPTLSILYL